MVRHTSRDVASGHPPTESDLATSYFTWSKSQKLSVRLSFAGIVLIFLVQFIAFQWFDELTDYLPVETIRLIFVLVTILGLPLIAIIFMKLRYRKPSELTKTARYVALVVAILSYLQITLREFFEMI